jgi:predicted RNase H-like nuclease (RuvC/YqgF family)
MQLANKRNQELIELQKQELSIKKQEDSPENNRLRNLEMEYKITELNEEINDYMREIDSLNDQIDKLKKENVIDRDSRNRRTFDNLKVAEGSRSRYSVISHSRVSDL